MPHHLTVCIAISPPDSKTTSVFVVGLYMKSRRRLVLAILSPSAKRPSNDDYSIFASSDPPDSDSSFLASKPRISRLDGYVIGVPSRMELLPLGVPF